MTKGKINLIIPALIFSMLLCVSCDNRTIFADTVSIPENRWELGFNPLFEAEINDTVNNYNIQFTIRNSSSYPFRNIFLFVTATSPDGISLTDTLEYMLASEKGEWYGKGFGDIHELTLDYKPNIYFPVKGNYKFSVQHGMRVEELNGIYDFGVRIMRRVNK